MNNNLELSCESEDNISDSQSSLDQDEYNGMPKKKINHILVKFQQQNILPSLNDRELVSSYIKHKNVEAIVKGDYLQAAKYEELHKKFNFECQKNDQKYIIEEEQRSVSQEIEQIKMQIESLKTNYESRIKQEKNRDSHVIQSLMDRHEKDMQNFNQYWSDPENLRQFCKGSSILISLRSKQKSLLIAKMFDEADQIRKEADKLEEEETLAAQENIKIHVSKKRALLEKKQLDELKRSRQFSVKIVDDLKAQMNKDEAQLNARLNKLQHDKDIIERKDCINESSQSVARQSLFQYENLNQPSLSPRSKVIIENFKRSAKPRRLILKPLSPSMVHPSRMSRHAFNR